MINSNDMKAISVFFIVILLSACVSTSAYDNVSIETSVPSSTVTVHPIQTLDLATPSPTLIPTIQAASTLPQPIWTTQPTLTGNEAIKAVKTMIATNGDCKLPCWWGIVPGETSWENALFLLSRFSPQIRNSDPAIVSIDGGNTYHNNVAYSINYKVPDNRIGYGASIVVSDDVVSMIKVGDESTGEIFTIPNILSVYGEPENIFIETYDNTPTGILPFYVILFYPQYRFTAVFESWGSKVGEMIRMCYQPLTPTIDVWSPEESVLVEIAGFSALVSGDWTYSKNLETATSLDVKGFYKNFVNASTSTCLETPSSLW